MQFKTFFHFLTLLSLAALLLLNSTPTQSAAPTIGFTPTAVTVQTGQIFYLSVIVNDVIDLYAWQIDVDYSETYLDLLYITTGPFLRSNDIAEYFLPPTYSLGLAARAAATRLSSHTGLNGAGTIAHAFFKAIKDTTSTSVTIKNSKLVDRNAIEISKTLINSGRSSVTINANAPVYIQPLAGPTVFVPFVRR